MKRSAYVFGLAVLLMAPVLAEEDPYTYVTKVSGIDSGTKTILKQSTALGIFTVTTGKGYYSTGDVEAATSDARKKARAKANARCRDEKHGIPEGVARSREGAADCSMVVETDRAYLSCEYTAWVNCRILRRDPRPSVVVTKELPQHRTGLIFADAPKPIGPSVVPVAPLPVTAPSPYPVDENGYPSVAKSIRVD